MKPLCHAYLIKGFLLAKEAPKEVMDAIEAIIEGASKVMVTGGPKLGIKQSIIGLPGSQTELDSSTESPAPAEPEAPGGEAESVKRSRRGSSIDPNSIDDVRRMVEEGISDDEISQKLDCTVSELKSFRRERGIIRPKGNPNFRKAKIVQVEAGERPDASSATPDIHKPTCPKSAPPPKPKALPPIDSDRLITVHNGYAGKRDPGQQLTDDDWQDIKARLAKSPDRRAIASDYDVDLDDLNFFIASCQRREGKSPGEALASPSGGASGAARPRW